MPCVRSYHRANDRGYAFRPGDAYLLFRVYLKSTDDNFQAYPARFTVCYEVDLRSAQGSGLVRSVRTTKTWVGFWQPDDEQEYLDARQLLRRLLMASGGWGAVRSRVDWRWKLRCDASWKSNQECCRASRSSK